jgi:2-iminoacetate synthase
MSFSKVFDQFNWNEVKESIYSKTAIDVVNALNSTHKNLEDFKALISPAALPFLEQMAQMSHAQTQKRFGKTIQLYIPLYLSNECQNICTYCGFSYTNNIPRRTLTGTELLREIMHIKGLGYDSILLVSGEANQSVGMDYFKKALEIVRPHFSQIAIEVQPLEESEYRQLNELGVNAVLVYQETYHKDEYKTHHPKGKKSNFEYRIDTPDRIGSAKMHKIGLGVLIGLEDWRTDSFFTALHLSYLEKTYWQSKYSISFPRLRPHAGGITPKVEMSDAELVQLICAYRIFNNEIELSLSTRESEVFRNNLIKLGITTMSAESKTNPGGYVVEKDTLEQFEINDSRSTAQIAAVIKSLGYEPVWKDWDKIFSHPNLVF